MATEKAVFNRVAAMFIIGLLSATPAFTGDDYPPEKYRDGYQTQYYHFPNSSAPPFDTVPLVDDEHSYFLSYDPFAIVIVGKRNEAGVISEAAEGRPIISFTAAMAELTWNIIFEARAKYLPVIIKRYPANPTITNAQEMATFIQVGAEPLQIKWTPAQPGMFDYQDPWYCAASVVFKPHQNSSKIKYTITNRDLCVPIAALIADAQAQNAKLEINHSAMSSERHLRHFTVEKLLRISSVPQK